MKTKLGINIIKHFKDFRSLGIGITRTYEELFLYVDLIIIEIQIGIVDNY